MLNVLTVGYKKQPMIFKVGDILLLKSNSELDLLFNKWNISPFDRLLYKTLEGDDIRVESIQRIADSYYVKITAQGVTHATKEYYFTFSFAEDIFIIKSKYVTLKLHDDEE